MIEQNTLQWYRSRLGKFSASSISKLIGKKQWTDTALTYIMGVAYERSMNQDIVNDDDDFMEYIDERSMETKSTRWGHLYEPAARLFYEMEQGVKVEECSSIDHPTIDNFSASPDGLVGDDGLIEIKCPFGREMWMKFAMLVHGGEDLKKVKAEYYWQCQCQLAVTGREWCDFIVYDPYLSTKMIVRRIKRNEDDIKLLEDTVKAANEYIDTNLKNLVKYEI